MTKQQKELPKASELLEVEWFNHINKKKYFINTSTDFLLITSNIFETENEAQNLIDLWDRAPELEKENEALKRENDALIEMITALRKFPAVNKVIQETIDKVKRESK